MELRPPRGRQLPAKPASRAKGVTTDPEHPGSGNEMTTNSPQNSKVDPAPPHYLVGMVGLCCPSDDPIVELIILRSAELWKP